ncbi:MAG: pyridoxamine 5'-phosphate oxidase [Bacteroidales bacterium]|jgi:pyridoxamine 5'-phosphate oxidase|nr:pyridoxamine 5'-phosphate oxidase [Bacteroidales bacterium]MDD4384534.1 pyridoxamine 5'-phosphate oxidase [Bacteroidales bacterium]MDY0197465.1 pyridoxamine 5'-phosphate oxidase [Tenuifilaceae bacterium]
MSTTDLSQIRSDYNLKQLSKSGVLPNPIEQFRIWMDEAIAGQCNEPNAMTLATSTFDGKPSARVVLLKDFNNQGFVFFTNYESNKGKQILQNPYAALVLFWPELQRQVRIEGLIVKTTEKESDEYFKTRPGKSKIGAWASPQSQVIRNRKYLESLKSDFQEEFSGKTISRPPNWGGYILQPNIIEFWQGRPNRLHDRIQYSYLNSEWLIERLAP